MIVVSSIERAPGEPGVGKTAVAEGLAHRMAANQVPQNLKGTLYNLDLGALFAGAGKGEYEEVRDTLKMLFYFPALMTLIIALACQRCHRWYASL